MDPLADYNPFANPFTLNQTAAASVVRLECIFQGDLKILNWFLPLKDPKTQDRGASATASVNAVPVIIPPKEQKQTPQQQASMSTADFQV